MLVFRPDVEVTEKSAQDKVKKLVGDEMTVDSVTVIGKKTLAYQIAKQKEGIYVSAVLSGTLMVPVMEKRIQLDGTVLRFLALTK